MGLETRKHQMLKFLHEKSKIYVNDLKIEFNWSEEKIKNVLLALKFDEEVEVSLKYLDTFGMIKKERVKITEKGSYHYLHKTHRKILMKSAFVVIGFILGAVVSNLELILQLFGALPE